ncbi:amidohydrolase family protein [Megasphaera cerevisiae]|nr:amidohydrolase family protein [Megasphaera cerevisiae]
MLMQEVYFCNVNVVDVKKKRIIQRQDVTMKNGKIASLIPHTEKKISGAIDCTGKYLCPGLMDMHVHLVWDGTLADPVTANIAEGPYVAMFRALHAAQEYLCRGITVVRDVGCNEDVTIYLAAAMRKNWFGVVRLFLVAELLLVHMDMFLLSDGLPIPMMS